MRDKRLRDTSQQEVRCTVGCFSEFSHSRDFIWDFVEHELNPCVCSESVWLELWGTQTAWVGWVSAIGPGQGTGDSSSITDQTGDTHGSPHPQDPGLLFS